MKKSLVIFVLIFSLLLCACDSGEDRDYSEQTDTELSTEVENIDNSDEDSLHENIERYNPDGYSSAQFAFKADDVVIQLTTPNSWTFALDSDGIYSVTREGKTVGMIISGASDDVSHWKSVQTKQENADGVSSTYTLEKNGNGDTLKFRYRFYYQYSIDNTERSLTLITPCSEICEFTLNKLFLSSMLVDTSDNAGFGILSKLKQRTSFLILGNSFINSSSIGNILQEMCSVNGKYVDIYYDSRPYATVNTYVNDSVLMDDIRSGCYHAVFICGFYSTSEVSNLIKLKEACDRSLTELVIFPAHNENSTAIAQAISATGLTCLNWKDEINNLISTKGISQWEFCVNDNHKHSTNLAGYVGAHMIYRAIYNTVPQKGLSYNISQTTVNSLLGDYVQTGIVKRFDTSKVHYFK